MSTPLPAFMTDAFSTIESDKDFLSENLKGLADETAKPAIEKAKASIQATKDSIEALQGDVALMCNQLPTKSERQKRKLTMLQLAMTARQLSADWFDSATAEVKALQGPRQGAIGTAKEEAKKILTDAGFDVRMFDWHNAIETHPVVKEARRRDGDVRAFLETTYERSRTNLSRLGSIKTEIEKIRDSLARELMEV